MFHKLPDRKIAYVVGTFPAISETFIGTQITDMIDRGYEISVFSFKESSPPYHKFVTDYKLKEKTLYYSRTISKRKAILIMLSLMFSSWNAMRGMLRYLYDIGIRKKDLDLFDFNMLAMAKDINRFHPDIIHIHFAHNAPFIAKMKKYGVLKKSKLVTTFHGFDIHRPNLQEGCYRDLYDSCDLFTVNTEYTRMQALDFGCPAGKIQKLPVGLDMMLFNPEPDKKTNHQVTILFIGRLVEFKAPDLVVEICDVLNNRGVDFICEIVGSGELFDDLSKQIIDLNLSGKVKLLGTKTQHQLIEIMNGADIFLYPGVYDKTGRAENQGLVVQEAQAMELPVVVSDVGGIPEGLINEVTGIVVPEKNIGYFADKIEYLIKNPETRREMGVKARAFVRENYSMHILGDKLEEMYNLILHT